MYFEVFRSQKLSLIWLKKVHIASLFSILSMMHIWLRHAAVRIYGYKIQNNFVYKLKIYLLQLEGRLDMGLSYHLIMLQQGTSFVVAT